jgi:hypothetical protein
MKICRKEFRLIMLELPGFVLGILSAKVDAREAADYLVSHEVLQRAAGL